jgi:hypothetical protein
MRVGPKVSSLTYKSRAKWKMLRWIYSAIYGEINVSVSVCVEIKGDYRICSRNLRTFFSIFAAEKSECVKYWIFFCGVIRVF